MKPYRLINSTEITALTKTMTGHLTQWCQNYFNQEISIELTQVSMNSARDHMLLLDADGISVALIDEQYLHFFSQALFGEDNPCYYPVCTQIYKELFSELFHSEQLHIERSINMPTWIYPGSTGIQVHLTLNQLKTTFILSPDWVYPFLSSNEATMPQLDSLDEALASQPLALEVSLLPITLSLKQLMNLKTGDVISSDHPLTTPIQIKSNNKTLALAELGQSSSYKSIQLKRLS